jgi:hypothetical protein
MSDDGPTLKTSDAQYSVALDIGTCATGFASTLRNSDVVMLKTNWPGEAGGNSYPKTTSALLYQQTKDPGTSTKILDKWQALSKTYAQERMAWKLEAWGAEAERQYCRLDANQRGHHYLAKHFKLALKNPSLVPHIPPGLSPKRMVTDLMTKLAEVSSWRLGVHAY